MSEMEDVLFMLDACSIIELFDAMSERGIVCDRLMTEPSSLGAATTDVVFDRSVV